jgi:hypothetical protein
LEGLVGSRFVGKMDKRWVETTQDLRYSAAMITSTRQWFMAVVQLVQGY